MRSDAIFASLPTTGTMDMRKNILAQLRSTSLEDLQEILPAVRLREAVANNVDNANECKDAPQDKPKDT